MVCFTNGQKEESKCQIGKRTHINPATHHQVNSTKSWQRKQHVNILWQPFTGLMAEGSANYSWEFDRVEKNTSLCKQNKGSQLTSITRYTELAVS